MEELWEAWEPETPEIAQLLSLAEREHLARRETREAVYDKPLEERVASGFAVSGLRFESAAKDAGGTVLLFSAERNDSRFRAGTRVRLSRGDPRKAAACLELVGDSFDGRRYRFRLSGIVEDPHALDTAESWVIDEDMFDLLEAQRELLRCAEKAGLARWIAGAEQVKPPQRPERSSPFARGLEGGMLRAFEECLASREWLAVQGPPGTGKTHLLARLALHYAAQEGARVLISAVSHQAIHNALGETYFVGRRMQDVAGVEELLADAFFKLGGSKGHNEGLPEGVKAAPRLPFRKGPLIAGATVYAAAHLAGDLVRRKPPYDVVLLDEAGQATLTLALGARLLGRKALFIGDDAQLPPIVELPSEEAQDPSARLSVIAHVRRSYGEPLLLGESRRLNAELCSVVSDCFYWGRLSPTPEARSRALGLARRPRPEFDEILAPGRPFVFLDVPHEDCRSVSEPEALWATAVTTEALRCGLPAEHIGIISPYRAQCNRIRFLLENPRVTCATVDRFQGQEREMVVISLTSSKPAYLARLAAFLFEPNRLNVAISRARTKVVLIGSRRALLRAAESSDADSPAAAGFQAFLKISSRAYVVDGKRGPSPASESARGVREEEGLRAPPSAASEGSAFEPGESVEHARYGAGVVVAKSAQIVDGRSEWVNEVRFADGRTRLLIARLCRPPMKRLG